MGLFRGEDTVRIAVKTRSTVAGLLVVAVVAVVAAHWAIPMMLIQPTFAASLIRPIQN